MGVIECGPRPQLRADAERHGGGGGLALEWERKCAELFPFTREVTAWKVGAREAIQLLDPKGQTMLELTEVEGGLYEGERPGEGLLFLQSVAAGSARAQARADGRATGRSCAEPASRCAR